MGNLQAGSRLGRYELLARLATGGMGEIFLARLEGAEGFEKLYVIKRILPHLADDIRFRTMLISEARIAANMSHPSICQVYELDERNGQLYIVMEYLEGITVLNLLQKFSRKKEPLDYGLIAGVIAQTCEALHYAHELKDRSGESLGIVHRDVSPSNVFLTETGTVKVFDFGIAKVKSAAATESGTAKGKYAYMAPEQLRGAEIDRRVDVFALGIVLFEMIALRRLFQRKTDYLTFRAVMEQPMLDVRAHRSDVPDALVDTLHRALSADREARFSTARELGAAVIESVSSVAKPWSHDEIAAFVRTNFATELARRSSEIESAARGGRNTLPVIVNVSPRAASIGDSDEFFTSESGNRITPVPQFSYMDRGSHPSVVSAARAQPTRSWLSWPWLSFVALMLVASIGLVAWRLGRSSAPASAVAADVERPEATRPTPKTDPYSAVIDLHNPDLRGCLRGRRHSANDIRATIVVGTTGYAKSVKIEPPDLAESELGQCLRQVLQSSAFPTADEDKQVVVVIRLS